MGINGVSAKRKDMGIVGAIVVLSQVLSQYQSTHTVSSEISDLKTSILEIKVDQEKNFVRKDQAKVFADNIESIKDDVKEIKRQIKHLRSEYASFDSKEITGCKFTEDFTHAFTGRNHYFTAFAY